MVEIITENGTEGLNEGLVDSVKLAEKSPAEITDQLLRVTLGVIRDSHPEKTGLFASWKNKTRNKANLALTLLDRGEVTQAANVIEKQAIEARHEVADAELCDLEPNRRVHMFAYFASGLVQAVVRMDGNQFQRADKVHKTGLKRFMFLDKHRSIVDSEEPVSSLSNEQLVRRLQILSDELYPQKPNPLNSGQKIPAIFGSQSQN